MGRRRYAVRYRTRPIATNSQFHASLRFMRENALRPDIFDHANASTLSRSETLISSRSGSLTSRST